jgi:hypothetical protein
MSFRLWDRAYKLQVGEVVIDSSAGETIDIEFSATRTTKREPNTLELSIFNLSENTRRKLQESEDSTARLEAGYAERSGVLFFGNIRSVLSNKEGPDWVTSIECGDGEKATQFDRVNKSFASGTEVSKVIKELAAAMPEIGIGNLTEMSNGATLPGGDTAFVNGVTVSGSAARELDKIVKSAGLEWSIQAGVFQLLKPGESLEDFAVVLTPETGLIGSPTVGSDGVISLTALLNSDIVPGRQLQVESVVLSGNYKAIRCDYAGSTTSGSWYVNVEAKELLP